MTARIAIAEDEPIIRLDVRETLEEAGYDVVGEAATGDEALTVVTETNPDLALVDIKMPGLDGIEVIRRLTVDARCPVVVLTAYGTPELIGEARAAGALGYVVKPFEPRDLIPAIEMALGRFADMAELRAESTDARNRLESRVLIDRAKGQLMDEHGLAERDAFRFLQQAAMDERLPLADVAQQVLDGGRSP